MRRVLCLTLLFCLLFASCRKDVMSEKVAEKVATQYFSYLLSGDYETYVGVSYREIPLPEGVQDELVDNLKMWAAEQEKARQGIRKAEVKEVEVNPTDSTANVFMTITYGNDTQEIILLPLIMKGGLWYVR